MRSCNPQEILAAIPNAQSFSLPDDWFDDLPNNIDVFSSLYRWMIDTRRLNPERTAHLPDRTYVGTRLAKRLLAAEKRRIARYAKLTGDKLKRALSWSDLDTGPRTEFAHRELRGDLIIVLPDDTETIHAIQRKWLRENNAKHLSKITKVAAGSNFYEWLVASCERNDPVGDFARGTMEDADFPRDADNYVDVRRYLENQNASDAGSSSAAEAWLEYADKYPERIRQKVLCEECGDEIYDLNGGLIACTRLGNFFEIVHMNCRDEGTQWQIQLDAASLVTGLRDYFQENAIPTLIVDAIEEQLRLSGFVLTPLPESVVYFIEANPSGAIKIGWSRSLRGAEKRRSDFQLARHPEILRIKAVMDGDMTLETVLKRRFAPYNLGGECFLLIPNCSTSSPRTLTILTRRHWTPKQT